uniref:Uncharacterized protein n=1 Tax=Anopheles darlingi TaxID=43151 RepID=A0A2M4DHX2_ANODA
MSVRILCIVLCVCVFVVVCMLVMLCSSVCLSVWMGAFSEYFRIIWFYFVFFCCFNPSSIGISIWVLAAACLLQLCVISLSPLLAFTHESTVFRAAAGNIALSKRYPCSSRFLMLCFLPLIPPARTCPICCCSFICLIIS